MPGSRGEHDRQRQGEPLPLGQVARVLVARQARHQPVQQRAAAAGCGAGALVGRGALRVDRLEVEQVRGGLRHQPDERASLGGLGRGGVDGRPRVVDLDLAVAALPGALQGPQQRRLARAVATHQRRGRARVQAQVDVAHREDAAVGHGHARRLEPDLPVGGGSGVGRGGQGEVTGTPPGVAHGERERLPAGRPAELDDRRDDRRVRQHLGRLADQEPAVAGEQRDPVGERQHPLEPVLGQEHRQPGVVHEAGQRRQHVFGGRRVERGGGLVEDEQPGVHRQHRPDRHPLLLAPRQGAQVSGAQVGDAQQVEGLLDPAAHRGPGQARAAPCRRRAPPRRCR